MSRAHLERSGVERIMSSPNEAPQERAWSLLRDGPPFLPVALLFIALVAAQQSAYSVPRAFALTAVGLAIAFVLEHLDWARRTPKHSAEVDRSFATLRARLDNPEKRPVRKLAPVPGPMLYPDPTGPDRVWSPEHLGPPVAVTALLLALLAGLLGGLASPRVGFAVLAVALAVALVVSYLDWARRTPSRIDEAMADFPTMRARLDAATAAARKRGRL
jgi:hypothetical protein